jgi:predicted Rossmann-fold nucleotide-binding protein
VDLAIYTHLPLTGAQGTEPLSRNHINVLSSDALVILPGGWGTRSEAILAVRYGRPAILFGPVTAFTDHPPELERADTLDRVEEFVDHALRRAGRS